MDQGQAKAEASADTDTLSAAEEAEMLWVSLRTAQNMARLRVVPAYRACVTEKAAIRFPRAGVLAYKAGGFPWAAVGQPKPARGAAGE